MAIFNYSKEEIRALKPEEGELALLDFLAVLDDSYEVFFQPNLNRDRPDIIILRKEYGVLVIEAKNFNSENSFIYNQQKNESPAEQVGRYKNNLYDFHINGLAEKKAIKRAYYGIVKCALYLHGYTEEEAKVKLLEYDKEYKNHSEWYSVIGKDSLNIDKFQENLSSKKDLFTNELYKEFKHVLEPSITDKEQVTKPVYSPVQNELINKLEPKQQKIKGPAGSGKTLILAQRAVYARKRTGGNILILTYNITLKNYIQDKISIVKGNLSRKDFGILNYHHFFNIEANNYGLKIFDFNKNYEDESFFESVKNEIKKYDAIFIDEIQDYKTSWIKIIKKYFLAENGEFIIFGDGKQKIYNEADTDMDSDESPNTTIKGKWNEQLTKDYRMFGKIGKHAKKFLEYSFGILFNDKQQELELPQKNKVLFIKHSYPENINIEKLTLLIGEFCKKNHIKESEICIISRKTEIVREIDYFYRKNNIGKLPQTTFEQKETYEQLTISTAPNKLEDELKTIRRSKKYNFYLNPGCIKLSTIHSFKGWEVPYVFLILDKDEQSDKLIYTAITRARYGLYVINLGNKKYNDFFVAFDSGN